VSKAPLSPYPPDPDEDASPDVDSGDLVDVTASDRDWANRRSVGFSARRVQFVRCRFTGAELAEAAISDARFDDCRLDLAALRHAKLERVAFRDCPMTECDFHGAVLKDVVFERCELRESIFSAASLDRVELRGCDLTGMSGAEALRGARMPWNDVLANAVLFAAVVGIEIVE
jgi:uncharacterized protein YjbI with pentapeptide repeats